MKKRIYGGCIFVFYLLALCLALSLKINDEMSTEVVQRPVIVNERSTGSYVLSPYCLYDEVTTNDDGTFSMRYAIYELVEGESWLSGLRVAEISSDQYSLYTEDGVFMLASFSTTYSRTVIKDASRQPVVGQQAVLIEQTTTEADQYLIYYPGVSVEYQECEEGYTLAAMGESSLLMDVAESPVPFLEEQAHETLYKIMTRTSEIYSLNDCQTFLRALPLAALVAVLLLLTLPLWVWIFLLLGKPRLGWQLLLAAGLIAALTLAAMFTLGQFDLPSSLMPTDNIFDFAYYRQEFETVFRELQELDTNQESGIYAAAAYAKQQCTACAIGGGLVFLLLALLPAVTNRFAKKRQEWEE